MCLVILIRVCMCVCVYVCVVHRTKTQHTTERESTKVIGMCDDRDTVRDNAIMRCVVMCVCVCVCVFCVYIISSNVVVEELTSNQGKAQQRE
jgi:hypothetical protein